MGSDKLKGKMASTKEGGYVATRKWKPVVPSRPTGKAVPRNWGAYVPLGDDVDGDMNTSSPYSTHRGILKGGDRREVDGGMRQSRTLRDQTVQPNRSENPGPRRGTR
jgi:hypothetical protein